MCDLVNSNFARHGKDCVKALKLKIMKKSAPDRQMLALIAFEMCMKNCGQDFHLMAIAKDVPHEMARLTAASGVAEEVHEKTLTLIREWAQQIRHPHLQDVYDHVRSKGVRFPPEVIASDGRRDGDARAGGDGGSLAENAFAASPAVSAAAAQPLYTPRLTTAEIIGANLERMDPADAAAIRAAVAEAEAEAEAMESAERAAGVVGSPPSSRRGGGVDFGGRAGVLRRDDGTPLNFDPPGAAARVGSPPRGYASLEEDAGAGPTGPTPIAGFRDPADDQHAADLLAAQRASAEEAAERARASSAAASMAAADLSSPEAVAKLKHDLAVAGETVASLRAALAAIDIENDPGAAAAGPAAQLAEQCRQMKPRVVALAESATDEGLLMTALALHDELGDVLDRRDAIAAAAAAEPEMRAALAASLAEEAARLALAEDAESAPSPVAATDALVDLIDAPSSSGGSGSPSNRRKPARAAADASLVDLLSADTAPGLGSPLAAGSLAAEKGKGVAVSDPFAAPATGNGNPFAAPATPGGAGAATAGLDDPFAASASSGAARNAAVSDPFALAAAAAASASGPAGSSANAGNPFAVHDPFAAAAATPSASTNPFAAPSPGGSGFGAVPATPPGSGSATRAVSNPLFDAQYNQAGAPMVAGSRPARGGASSASPAPVPTRPAANADPFAALAEAARSPEKNPFASAGK